MAGVLSHQILLPLYKRIFASKIEAVSNIATYLLIIFSLIFFVLPGYGIYKNLILFASFIVFLPFTFIFSNNSKWDRYFGELSYPIYIGHMLVIIFLRDVMAIFPILDKGAFSLVVVLLSILLAIILNKYIGTRVEDFRSRFRSAERSPIRVSN